MKTGAKLLWLYAAFLVAFLYAPVLLLPVFSFNASSVVAFPLKGFTLEWFRSLLNNTALRDAALNSLNVAASVSAASTLLGMGAARALTRYRFPMRSTVAGTIMVPLFLPEIVIGVSLLVAILQLGIELSLWSIAVGHILICTPFSVAVLTTAFRNLDTNLEDAAIDLGESEWATFRLVTLPLVFPGIVASLLMTFTISLDEFIIAFFLAGTETTLPVYIWSQLRFPARLPNVMALGTILLAASVALITAAELFRRRAARLSAERSVGDPA